MLKKSPKKIYGLIGYPVKHSLSGFMHNAAFKALGINAEYRLFELMPTALEDFLKQLKIHNIAGLNVTIPYKERVLPFIGGYKSSQVKLTGAVNTIRLEKDNRLSGFNSDVQGFSQSLKELKFNPIGKKIAIIGAGGVSKAISLELARQKASGISIYDIDLEKVKKLIDNLKANFPKCKLHLARNIQELEMKDSDLLINATPIGMKLDDPILVEKKDLHSNLLVYDLIYNPQETKLLKLAKEMGSTTSNGLNMLLYQGMESFEIWTGKIAPKEVMQKALLDVIGR